MLFVVDRNDITPGKHQDRERERASKRSGCRCHVFLSGPVQSSSELLENSVCPGSGGSSLEVVNSGWPYEGSGGPSSEDVNVGWPYEGSGGASPCREVT